MQNINEMKDEDNITILRYCPCEKKYVKKENDDEVLYSKEEWENKKANNKDETQKACSPLIKEKLEILRKCKERQARKMLNKKLPSAGNNQKLMDIRKRFKEFKLSKKNDTLKF